METSRKRELQIIANHVRQGVIEGTYHAKSGHPGGSLSIAETLTYLYYEVMRNDPRNPKWEQRDRLVLSKGHCCPALYAVLAERGYFPKEELQNLRHIGALLQGHPDMKLTPGIDMSSGSLGQGISAACGMALAAKLRQESWRVYCVLGDGEIEEGQVWEAAMFAKKNALDHLICVVDNNDLQIDGRIADVSGLYPIDEKFRAFGWAVFEADAHDFDSLEAAFTAAQAVQGQPSVIIQKSIKGKGVSYMEDVADWHGKAPNAAQYEQAMQELNAALAALEG